MSDSENPDNVSDTEETENTATQPAEKANLLATAMELKDSNPKVFFGAIGAVVILLLMIVVSSGSSNKLPQRTATKLTKGQQYTLKGANRTVEGSSISLASKPGVTAFDEDHLGEEASEHNACRQISEGTSVSILELQKVQSISYAKIKILDGECQDKDGWVLSIDIQ